MTTYREQWQEAARIARRTADGYDQMAAKAEPMPKAEEPYDADRVLVDRELLIERTAT